MSTVLIAKLSAGSRRLDESVKPARPYLQFPATVADVPPIMLFVGLSKAQRSPSRYKDGTLGPAMADSEAKALGFADHLAAIKNPELTEGREVRVAYEEPGDAGPGGWKIVTSGRSVDLPTFEAALAAQS